MILAIITCLALRLPHLTAAQSDSVTDLCSQDITITTNDDSARIANCSRYLGDITISPDASGEIDVNGIKSIEGTISCSAAHSFTGLSGDSVTFISGLELDYLPTFSKLSFPKLQQCTSISLKDLPVLQTFDFTAGFHGGSDGYLDLTVSNTGLTDLAGIDPQGNQVTITISGNPNLQNISWPDMTGGKIYVAQNGANFDLDLPNVNWTNELELANITSLSIPALEYSSLLQITDSPIHALSLPKLSEVTTVKIVNSLEVLDLPALTEFPLGPDCLGLTIDDPNLREIKLDALQAINNDVQLVGTFDSLNFASLTFVYGIVNVTTASTNASICDAFDRVNITGWFDRDNPTRQNFTCTLGADIRRPDRTNNNGSSSVGSVRHSSGLSAGAVAGIVVGVVVVLLLITGILFYCLRRRSVK